MSGHPKARSVFVGRTLRPGARGTKKLLRQHGQRLLCVRYLYDPIQRRRLTTVELVVDEAPWNPPLVALRLDWAERDLAHRLRAAGATHDRGLWLLPRDHPLAAALADRVVPPAGISPPPRHVKR